MYIQEILIEYTITKQKKRRYNHGSNKLDNYQKRKSKQPNANI